MSKISRFCPRLRRAAKKRVFSSAISSAALGLGVALAPMHVDAASPYLAQTKQGPVSGFLGNSGVVEFLGIPYAKPPVGNLRWRPPQNPAPWSKTLKATQAGPICLQVTTLGPFAGPANANEDCLYLNVYTPDLNASKKQKLPCSFGFTVAAT